MPMDDGKEPEGSSQEQNTKSIDSAPCISNSKIKSYEKKLRRVLSALTVISNLLTPVTYLPTKPESWIWNFSYLKDVTIFFFQKQILCVENCCLE